MTQQAVATVYRAGVFDPYPALEDLAVLHVPFDSLAGTSRVEGAFAAEMEATGRVGIVGVSGGGKSSCISYVLGPLVDGIVPFRVPVNVEDADTVSDPQAFVLHAVRMITRAATASQAISESDRRRSLRDTDSVERIGRPGRLGVRMGVGGMLGPEIAADLVAAGDGMTSRRSAAESWEAARTVLAVVAQHGMTPVLQIDDSDTWLADRVNLADDFFGRVLRPLADLPAHIVVAIHEAYLDRPPIHDAVSDFLQLVRLPWLTQPESLERIVRHRLNSHELEDVALDAVFVSGFIDELHRFYDGEGRRSLRRALRAVHTSLHRAYTDEADIVTHAHLQAAIAEH